MPIATGETWDEQLNSLAHSIAGHYKTKPKVAPEYDKICRVILASVPPRAVDLPSHLVFCKKCGGGKDQKLVFDICDFIKMNAKTNIVNGNIFEALAKLQFEVSDMCPEFVAVVVKCAATRGAGRNGIVNHIIGRCQERWQAHRSRQGGQ